MNLGNPHQNDLNPAGIAPPRGAPSGDRSEADVLQVLSEFESGLECLKALYIQRQDLQARLREHETGLSKRESDLAAAVADHAKHTAAQADAREALDHATADLRRREADIASQTKEFEAAHVTVLEEERERLAALESRRRELDDQAGKLADRERVVNERADAIASQAFTLERDRIAITAEKNNAQSIRAELECTRGEAQEAKRQLEQIKGRVEGLGQAAAKFEKLWTVERDEAARLKDAMLKRATDTTELEGSLGTLRERLKSELANRQEAQQAIEAADAKAAAAAAQAQDLQAQLAEALRKAAAFEQAAQDKPRITGDLAILRRRQRLRRCRELIREQTAKVRKGSEAIKTRYQQLEKLLAQRSELVVARDKIIEAERKLQHARAANRAAVVSLCAVAIFAILGGLSWALAREVAPATFIASSWLKADGPSRDLNEAELEEWQRYHEDLLKDPHFHAVAAERFKRQAVTSLASASSVATLLSSSLTTQSPANGELKLELAGQGADNTARTLDTITAAFASHANAAQQRRIDGGRTVVSQPAQASSDPIDNTRTLYALAMAAVGVAAAGALAMFVWRRLTGVKTSFEHDGQVAAALAGSHWPDPSKES